LLFNPAYLLIGALGALVFSDDIERTELFPVILSFGDVCFLSNPHLLTDSSSGIYSFLYFPDCVYLPLLSFDSFKNLPIVLV
jgi:hypothetical protein